MDNARRFLWDEDEAVATRARTSANSSSGGNQFNTRDFAVDQSVNLMALDDGVDVMSSRSGASNTSNTSRLSGSIAGLFRATTGTEGRSGASGGAGRFDEYGDAAPSADAEEYISVKQRRMTPLWSALVNACNAVSCGGLKGMRLVICVAVGIILVAVGLILFLPGDSEQSGGSEPSSTVNTNDPRYMNIKERIITDQITPQDVLESSISPQQAALQWIVDEDPAKLPFDHPALMDRYSLAVFYYSSINSLKTPVAGGWTNSDGWLTEKGICAWYGIQCLPREQEATAANNFAPFSKTYDDNARITGILLPEMNIEGVIPEEWGVALDQLTILDLQDNKLSNHLPSSLGNLMKLRDLLVRGNDLVGQLPSELGALTNLHQLNLAKNEFSGNIPASWSNLKELRNFAVSHNLLTGGFPDVSKMTRMLGLFLDNNDFEGEIPTYLETFTDLCKFFFWQSKHYMLNRFSSISPFVFPCVV